MTLRRSIRLPTHIRSSRPISNNHPSRSSHPTRRQYIPHPAIIRTGLRTH